MHQPEISAKQNHAYQGFQLRLVCRDGPAIIYQVGCEPAKRDTAHAAAAALRDAQVDTGRLAEPNAHQEKSIAEEGERQRLEAGEERGNRVGKVKEGQSRRDFFWGSVAKTTIE